MVLWDLYRLHTYSGSLTMVVKVSIQTALLKWTGNNGSKSAYTNQIKSNHLFCPFVQQLTIMLCNLNWLMITHRLHTYSGLLSMVVKVSIQTALLWWADSHGSKSVYRLHSYGGLVAMVVKVYTDCILIVDW